MNRVVLCLAQGFFVGRMPVSPGTFGSVLGVGWLGLLLLSGTWWVFALGSLLAIVGSIWLCGKAEEILGQTDPGSIVLDEIVAVPLCFVAWLSLHAPQRAVLPSVQSLFAGHAWLWTGAIFAAFRLFDILKPWPVRQSQRLPGGWGVTIDDILAALYVNVSVLICEAVLGTRP